MPQHTVCLLNDAFPPTIDGVANAVLNYAECIESRHGHALVVTPAVPGADDSVYPFPVLRYPSVDTRKLVGYVTGYPFSPGIARRVRLENTELLHLHCPMTSAFLARQLKEAQNLPLVMTYHTKYDIEIARAIRLKRLQESAAAVLVGNISACDEVWVVSRGAGDNLRALGYEGNTVVMQNGVDLPRGRMPREKAEALTAGWDLPRDVPVFLFVGRLMWYKGLRTILGALKRLWTGGIPFRMVFVGDGADGEAVRACAAELGLGGVCFFPGAVSDRETLRAWYARADLFLFPSTFDTNGLVVREAAASDLASVLIEGSCAAEGIDDGRTGFLFDGNDVSLASRLEALCAAPETVKRVGEAAGREIYLSWEDAVSRAADRYETVLEKHRSGFYERRREPLDALFRTQGELMEALGELSALGREIRGEIQAGQANALEKLKAAGEGIRDRVDRGKQALWQKLDRYL